jgi:ACS family glucarate transporter-like MFS transporter
MGTDPAPTAVRYRVVAFLAGMTFVLYLDRVCIGQAAPAIQAELGLSDTRMGLVFAAFTVAYGLFEVPTGRLGDRFGSRRVLTRVVLWWSAFTALTGAATGFYALLAVRFLFGAGEAGALPNAVRVVVRWFPEAARGTAQGVVVTAMMLGGAVSPVVAAYLIGWVGWRATFVLFGGIGVVWAVGFYRWFRDEPADHPGVNPAERALIDAGRPPPRPAADDPIPWRRVLGSRNVWVLGGLMCCASAVYYAVISWYPKYLQAGRGLSPEQSGALASLALGGGVFGALLGGLLTDCLFRWTGNPVLARCRVGSAAYLAGGVALLLGVWADRPLLAAGCTAVAVFGLQVQIPGWWATVAGISGRHVGSLAGLMNSMGVVGAIVSQVTLGAVADWLGERGYDGRGRWDPGLQGCAAVMLAGAVLWVFVRPGRPIEPPARDQDGRASG